MKKCKLMILTFLCIANGFSVNATTIYAVPSELKVVLPPIKDIEIKKNMRFDALKKTMNKRWGITIFGYIYGGASKRDPNEEEWKKDLQEILEKNQDLYLITRPKAS